MQGAQGDWQMVKEERGTHLPIVSILQSVPFNEAIPKHPSCSSLVVVLGKAAQLKQGGSSAMLRRHAAWSKAADYTMAHVDWTNR